MGRPPALASAFQPREELREQILAGRRGGVDVVLAPAGAGGGRSRGGGVGKSQLAAWFARDALDRGVDLVVWVDATRPERIVTSYAHAARRVNAPGAGGADPTADAAAFLEWLRTTDRTWLVVLDDITDRRHLTDPDTRRSWWPPERPQGWTVATTRLPGATVAQSGRRCVKVPPYTPEESAAYLTERLTSAGCEHLLDDRVADLAEALRHLPVALCHAAGYLINQGVTCADYLARYHAEEERLSRRVPERVDLDGAGRTVAVTLRLALDAADTAEPVGLARPAMAFAACCDVSGHPPRLWSTRSVQVYLSPYRPGHDGKRIPMRQAGMAMRLLHRYGLLSFTGEEDGSARVVRVDGLTARVARDTIACWGPGIDVTDAVDAVADGLLELWPEDDRATSSEELAGVLRANAVTLMELAGDALWSPEGGHPLLFHAGHSLSRAGLFASAASYWKQVTEQARRQLGEEHPETLSAMGNLATSYTELGRVAEAIPLQEKVLARWERLFGTDHPAVVAARVSLANSYYEAGRFAEAIALQEKVVADQERMLGEDHPDTVSARANLASSYKKVGRVAEAIALQEKVLGDCERVFGEVHPTTLRARVILANWYYAVGRVADAIPLEERVVAGWEWLYGAEHPTTLIARVNLAVLYHAVGRVADAVSVLEHVVAGREQLLGKDHPDTVAVRNSLREWQATAKRSQES